MGNYVLESTTACIAKHDDDDDAAADDDADDRDQHRDWLTAPGDLGREPKARSERQISRVTTRRTRPGCCVTPRGLPLTMFRS